MRDPQRISIILKKLEFMWQAVPDQRFGQLVHNIFLHYEDCSALYYKEDNEFEELLDKFIEKHTGRA